MSKTLLVLPKPSRFDKANDSVLAGPARKLCDETLGADTYDVCYADEFQAQRAGRAHIILSGQESLDAFQPRATLSSARGFVWHLGPTKIVATFWPQDALDRQNYEAMKPTTMTPTPTRAAATRTTRLQLGRITGSGSEPTARSFSIRRPRSRTLSIRFSTTT